MERGNCKVHASFLIAWIPVRHETVCGVQIVYLISAVGSAAGTALHVTLGEALGM